MNEGCQVEVISFGRSTSQKLREAADDFIDMDEDPKKYLITYSGWGKPTRRPVRRSNAPKARGNQSPKSDRDFQNE
jgi:hypothetical protein